MPRFSSVVVDLFTIQILTSFRESPFCWFALLGLLGEFVDYTSTRGSGRRLSFREWRKKP
jgi:hypothetical protein